MTARAVLCGALVLVVAGGCDERRVDEGDVFAPGTQAGSIGGSVRSNGNGVSGIVLTLSGPATRSTATAASGEYAFIGLSAGTYTVTITVPTGLALAAGEAAERNATVVAGQTTVVDYALVDLNPVTTINLSGTSFSPADIQVARGTRVRWVNGSGVLHTVTPQGHSEWPGVNLNSGSSFEHTFDNAGTFQYLCQLHVGMTGVIRVQ